jgi:hypothetical protein
MISRPTTDVLVEDCCRELTEGILPAIEDETLKLRLIMTVTVLGNAAVRTAHEIAWMRDETTTLLTFAQSVAASHEDGRLGPAIDEVAAAPRDSLHLADVADVYERAGHAFDVALQVAQQFGAAELIAHAAEVLRARIETEKAVMGGYAVVGR